MHWAVQSLYSGVLALLVYMSGCVEAGIGCFKCSSINGSEPGCRDPFHPAMGDFYHPFCRQTVTKRVGQFPAKYCTKIKGINSRTKAELLVRSCDMESGFDNTCGTFIFEGDEYHGCLMSCKTNACNSATPSSSSSSWLFLLLDGRRSWSWWWWGRDFWEGLCGHCWCCVLKKCCFDRGRVCVWRCWWGSCGVWVGVRVWGESEERSLMWLCVVSEYA